MASERILVIEHDTGMVDLFKALLEGEGYQVEWLLERGDVIPRVREIAPDVLLVDLLPGREAEGGRLLDALRTDPATSHIPVVVMTTFDPLAESAKASYNVRASLTKPFDMSEFLLAVQHALNTPPLATTSRYEGSVHRDTSALAQRILAERSREVLFRWVERLQLEPPWQGRDDLRLAALLDSVPLLMEAVTATLRYGDPDAFFSRHPDVIPRVQEHARTRKKQGFPLPSLVREYSLLRHEIWRVFGRYLPEQVAAADAVALSETVNLSLDRLVEVTIPAYLEA